ncbi:MAG: aminodeoxychorismate/anthranilate synthase component II [Chthonomonadales bacterium]|nr:aminodeoxychorismate/anthranilate synthase component II [Chthonomonadales bacterium]
MILVIDNYDSFTYNLVQYLGEMGQELRVRRNDEVTVEEAFGLGPAAIVISPGPCTPDQAGVSVPIVRELAARIPILGVCLGHQSIGRAFGAGIVRNWRVLHGKTSRVSHDGRGLFAGLPDPIEATRYHSLVIDPETVPACLEVTARTPEGEIMGVRHREHRVEGVQFHPESVMTPEGKGLLRNFLALAGLN